MSPDPHPGEAGDTPRLTLIVFDGGFERVHYALVLASAAVAINRKVTLFMTGRALLAVSADPGWRGLDPGHDGLEPARLDQQFTRQGVARFEELLTASAALGARFIACEMGLRRLGMTAADLRPDIPILVAGVVTMLSEAGSGQIVYI